MILVLGTVLARPETLEQVTRIALEHVRRSRTEPGCLLHSVQADVENPNRLVFIEHWTDRAALDEHFRVPESRAFVAAARDLCAAAPTIEIYEAAQLPF